MVLPMINTHLKAATRKAVVLPALPRDPYLGKGDLVENGLKPSKRKNDL